MMCSFFLDPPDHSVHGAAARASSAPLQQQAALEQPAAVQQPVSEPAYMAPQGGESYVQPSMTPMPRETVAYDGPYAPGTIVISTEERRLYLVLPDHQALRYGVGVGRPGFEWSGVKTDHGQARMAGLDASARDAEASARSAAPYGRRHRKPARRPRDVSRRHHVSHPRLERAGHDRRRPSRRDASE